MAAVEDVEDEADCAGVNWRLVMFRHGCRRHFGGDVGDGVEDALRIGAWSLELGSHASLGDKSWRVSASAHTDLYLNPPKIRPSDLLPSTTSTTETGGKCRIWSYSTIKLMVVNILSFLPTLQFRLPLRFP